MGKLVLVIAYWELGPLWGYDQLHNQLVNHLNVVRALYFNLSFSKSFDWIYRWLVYY